MERPVYARRYNAGNLTKRNGAWIVRYYPATGVPQRSITVGRAVGKERITESEAKRRKDEIIRNLNAELQPAKRDITIAEFLKEIYIPVKAESEWREGTAQTTIAELERWIVPTLGPLRFSEIKAEHFRKLLMNFKTKGETQRTIDRTRFYIASIVEMAIGDGLLEKRIHEGMVKPSSTVAARTKRIVSIQDYVKAWLLLDEREWLIWDLIMFIGLRKCEVFALQRKHVESKTIRVEQGLYLGKIVGPKTYGSRRSVGLIPSVRERLDSYMGSLVDVSPDDWLFPSATLRTPMDPNNLRTDFITPKLKEANLNWISFKFFGEATPHTIRKSALTRPPWRSSKAMVLEYMPRFITNLMLTH